jgi:hypothetical protein
MINQNIRSYLKWKARRIIYLICYGLGSSSVHFCSWSWNWKRLPVTLVSHSLTCGCGAKLLVASNKLHSDLAFTWKPSRKCRGRKKRKWFFGDAVVLEIVIKKRVAVQKIFLLIQNVPFGKVETILMCVSRIRWPCNLVRDRACGLVSYICYYRKKRN